MAEQKKFLDLTGLTEYDGKIKETITQKGNDILNQSKTYTNSLSSNYDPAGTAQTKVSELENGQVATNKSNIEALQSSKADKSTTIEGYGITDAYTKTQTDSAIASAVANADHLKREIVSVLPDVNEADNNTIYMVGTGAGSEDSAYEEYMLLNGAFEKIGSSEVDLTNYATKDYVSTEKEQAINSAKSYADSLSVNYATAEQGSKADSALQANNITTGLTNGTIAVSGSDVQVKGLESAAYKTAGSSLGNVPVNGSALGNTPNVPVVVNASGQIIPHASGALGTAAFVATSAFDPAGTAQTKVTALENGQVATNTSDIVNIKSDIEELQASAAIAITTAEIEALFD